MKITFSLTLLLFSGIFIIGCDSDSGTSPTTSLATRAPKVGSSFTFNQIRLDSLGKKVIASDVTQTDSVVEAMVSLYGKTNVAKIVGVPFGQLKYFNYELNGDISEYIDYSDTPPLHSFWATYPIQSRATKLYTLIDTTVTVSGVTSHVVSTVSVSYEGISTLAIYDSTLTMIKIKTVGVNSVTSPVQNYSDSLTAYYYFAASIGYIAKQRQEPNSFGGGSEETLVSFRLP